MRGAQLRSFEQFVETHFRGILLFALAVVVVTVTVIVLLEMIVLMSVIIDITITIAIVIIVVVVGLGLVQHRTRCLHVVAELVLILVRMAALLRLH